ncbi:MAG: hypothetical protein PF448_02900 [Bacteroidales bacterium]|jgi:hypothetical protein|nr:hypothetical protein [Bacteroidales bacterium]
MKISLKVVLSLVFVLGLNFVLIAQESDPFNYYVRYQPVNVQNTTDTVYQIDFCLLKESLSNVNLISEVDVSVGSYKGAHDIFSYVFILDSEATLPNGMSISSNESEIVLTIGEFLPQAFYFSVTLKTLDGTIIGPVFKK